MEKRKVPVFAALILIAALLLIPGFTVSAQVKADDQKVGPGQFAYGYAFQKPLKLTPDEQKAIWDVLSKDQNEIAKARADIRISQAKVSRLMLEDNPDMDAISAELDSITQFEKTIEMIQIQRQIEIKKLLGEDRYNELVRLLATKRSKGGREPFGPRAFGGKPRAPRGTMSPQNPQVQSPALDQNND